MLEVRDLFKTYAGKPLLNGISFVVREGETVCLLGASGSGKSTLLQIIAGLEPPDSGSISFNGLDLASTPPHVRDFGLVFQDYSLFPHLNVRDNVAFGLKMRRLNQSEINLRVARSLNSVNLEGFEARKVTELSGGEQQRVALARALAIRPRLLMFDEPLGALDKALRESLLSELRAILHRTGIPAIYVTHDQEEAFTIADRMLILHGGEIIREGSPSDIFAGPRSAVVAKFLGLGNIIDAEVVAKNRFRSNPGDFAVRCDHKHTKGEKVSLLVRPLPAETETNVVRGIVSDIVFQQDRFKVTFENGLYFHLKDAPGIGKKVSVRVRVECLA